MDGRISGYRFNPMVPVKWLEVSILRRKGNIMILPRLTRAECQALRVILLILLMALAGRIVFGRNRDREIQGNSVIPESVDRKIPAGSP